MFFGIPFGLSPNSPLQCAPIGLKYLTRLRVGLTYLKSHKFNNNFRDTPNPYCECDGITEETADHYLLHCPFHHEFRLKLFNVLKSKISIFPLSKSNLTYLFLYGNHDQSISINKFIIQSVI